MASNPFRVRLGLSALPDRINPSGFDQPDEPFYPIDPDDPNDAGSLEVVDGPQDGPGSDGCPDPEDPDGDPYYPIDPDDPNDAGSLEVVDVPVVKPR